jgi:hypothetical protein
MDKNEKVKYLCEFFVNKMYEGKEISNVEILRDLQVFNCFTLLLCARTCDDGLEFLQKTLKLLIETKDKTNFGTQVVLQHFIDDWEEGEGEEDNG